MILKAVLAGILLSSAAAAQTAEEAEAIFEAASDRYDALLPVEPGETDVLLEIRRELETAARAGHASAANLLGTMALSGHAGLEGPDTARAYFEQAHAAGDPAATLNLAALLLDERADTDQARGIRLLEPLYADDTQPAIIRQAAAGHLGAAVSVGLGGEPIDHARGFALLSEGIAGVPDNPFWNYLLARYYESGASAPLDPELALRHFIIAADGGEPRASWKAGMAYIHGEGVEPEVARAFRYIEQSAHGGYDDGMISLAVMHAIGQGTEVDPDAAREWYWRAASRGNAHAMRGLGAMLLFGEGGVSDPVRGYALLQLAREAGDARAARILDQIVADVPTDQDWTEAVADARSTFLGEAGLTPADLYGAQP